MKKLGLNAPGSGIPGPFGTTIHPSISDVYPQQVAQTVQISLQGSPDQFTQALLKMMKIKTNDGTAK